MIKHRSTKRFDGLSVCFRQWRADSHCRFLHGYALEFVAVFEGELDHRNWVLDFGSFKSNGFKAWLADTFDHKTIVAEDDPLLSQFKAMDEEGMLELVIMPSVGCEKFAERVKRELDAVISRQTDGRVQVLSVECIENKNNSAVCHETHRY